MQDKTEGLKRISLRDVLFVIFSKLHVFLGIYLTLVLTTAALAFLLPPVYEVSGHVLVKPFLEPHLKLQAPLATNIRANPVTPQDINSEVNLLKSPQLLKTVVERLGLDRPEPASTWLGRLVKGVESGMKHLLVSLGLVVEVKPEDRAILELQNQLNIRPITLSNLIEISLKGPSPEKITKIVNTLLENYVDFHIQVYRVQGAKDFYAQQAEIFHRQLKETEADLKKFKNQYGVIDLTAQNEANVELLRTLRESLALTEAQIRERQLKVGVQSRNLARTGEPGALTKEVQSAILEELVRVLGPLLVERERLAIHYQKSSAKYRAVDRQVQEIKEAYQKQVRELLKGAQLDLEGLKNYADTIRGHIKKLEGQSLMLSQKQVDYERLLRDLKQNEKNYLLYLNKTEEARIEEQQEANRVSNVTVTTWAQVPSIPVFPKRFLMLLLAGSLGLLVALAGAFFAYYVDHTIKTPSDLGRYAGLPVFATIDLVERRTE
uniref:Uncharacterized protein n=1 Tax=Desulfobacca acetoxidans TaxID=60893 RepID=A0A7C5EP42_9BACT